MISDVTENRQKTSRVNDNDYGQAICDNYMYGVEKIPMMGKTFIDGVVRHYSGRGCLLKHLEDRLVT